MPLFTNRWRISGSRGRESHGTVKTQAGKCGVWSSTWGMLQGSNEQNSCGLCSSRHPSFGNEWRSNNWDSLHWPLSALYRGRFQWWKAVEYTGGMMQVFMPMQWKEKNAADLSWAAHMICLFLHRAVVSFGNQHSGCQKIRAQISCVMFSLHSTDSEYAIKSCTPKCHLSVPEFRGSKCHLRKAQGLYDGW